MRAHFPRRAVYYESHSHRKGRSGSTFPSQSEQTWASPGQPSYASHSSSRWSAVAATPSKSFDRFLDYYKEAKNTKQLFESRESSEKTGSLLPARNRVYAPSITKLLDRHKSVTTHEELVALAEEFKIDADKLKSLARFVNSPSVDEASIRPAPGSKKDEDVCIVNVGFFT